MNAPQLPAYLQTRQSRGLAATAIANLGAGSPPYVSIQSNRFTLIDSNGTELPVPTYDPQAGPYLDCVIVDANDHISKVFYDKKFDPNASAYEAPACFSDNGLAPSRAAAKPQARTCAECQWNVWGSKTSEVTGAQVKACSDQMKVAVLTAHSDIVFLFRIPPGSLKNYRAYANKFAGQAVDIDCVITRISFVPQGVGMLKFDAVNYASEQQVRQVDEIVASKKTDSLVGRTDQPRTDALPAPQTAAALPAPEYAQPMPAAGPATPANYPPATTVVQAPFVPAAAPQPMPMAQQPVQPQPMPAGPAIGASLSEPPKRGRKRNTAAAAPVAPATQAPFAAAPAATPTPQPTAAPFAAPAQSASAPPFGMASGVAPNPELSAALGSIFGNG